MPDKLKVILVGLGKMGEKWIDTINNSNFVVCVGYVESNSELLKKIGVEYGLSYNLLFTDIEKAFQNNVPNFIINVTPPSVHKEVSFKAFQYGVHVLSEKPIADSLESAIDILNEVKSSNLKYMISQDYRFNNGSQTLYNQLLKKKIGLLGHIDLTFNRNPKFEANNFRLTELDYPMIMDMSIHHFDLMRYFTKANPISITTRSYNPSWSQYIGDAAHSMIIEFDDFHINYTGSWCALGPHTNRAGHWQIDGSKGSLTWDGMDSVYITKTEDTIETEILPLIDLKYKAQEYSLTEFVESIKNNREPVCSINDNITSFAMVFCAIESAKRREEVFLEEIVTNIVKRSAEK